MFRILILNFFFFCAVLMLAGCPKKHGRGANERDEIKIQVGGNQSQGGSGGDLAVAGGVDGGFTAVGGKGGDVLIGGQGGDFVSVGGTGGDVLIGGQGGDFVGVGGTGGDILIGGQGAVGGHGGDNSAFAGAGGDPIEPQNQFQYAPTPWPTSTKLGIQSISSVSSCGDIPLADLQPLFEPMTDARMDEDPDNPGTFITKHWVYKGPTTYANSTFFTPFGFDNRMDLHDLMFSWTADRRGKYTFQFARQVFHQNPSFDDVIISVRRDCGDHDSTFDGTTFFFGQKVTTNPQNGSVNVWAEMGAGDTVYVVIQGVNPERFDRDRDVLSLIQVYYQDEPTPPVIESTRVSRGEAAKSYVFQYRGYDADADALQLQVQFLPNVGGDPRTVFVDENDAVAQNNELAWIDVHHMDFFAPQVGKEINVENTWGLRSFEGYAKQTLPFFFNEEGITYARVRLCDAENLCSNVVETEILQDVFTLPVDESCFDDLNCMDPQICRYSEQAALDGNDWPYRCTDRVPSQITEVIANQTEDSLLLSMIAESSNHDLAWFLVEFLNEQDEVIYSQHYSSLWDTNKYFFTHTHAQEQTRFERQVHLKLSSFQGAEPHRVRVTGYETTSTQMENVMVSEANTEPVVVDIAPMPIARLREPCDQHGVENICEYGLVCVEQGGDFLCEEAQISSILNATGKLFQTGREIEIDLEVNDETFGYKIRGLEGVSTDEVFYVASTSEPDDVHHAKLLHRVEDNVFDNNRPERVEVSAVDRNGYSSAWQGVALEFVPSGPFCQDVVCDAGFTCYNVGERFVGVCLETPEPILPALDQGMSIYFPRERKLVIQVEGVLQDTSVNPLEFFQVYVLAEDGSVLMRPDADFSEDISGSHNTMHVEGLGDGRSLMTIEKYFPIQKNDNFSYYADESDFLNVNPESAEQVRLQYGFHGLHLNMSDVEDDALFTLDMPLLIATALDENEVCEPNPVDSYCGVGLECVQNGQDYRCQRVESPTCDSGMLNADLNQYPDPAINGWSITDVPLDQYSASQEKGSCSQRINAQDMGVHIYRLEVEREDDYFVQAVSRFRNGRTAVMWIRGQCNFPETEIDCQFDLNDDRINPNTRRYAESIIHLVPGEPVYIFVGALRVSTYEGTYSLSVKPFELPQNAIVSDDPLESKVYFNPQTGRVEFDLVYTVDRNSDFLSKIDLVYQVHNGARQPIVFRNRDGDPIAENGWVIEQSNLVFGSRDIHAMAQLPVLEDELDQVQSFEVWFKAGDARTDSTELFIEPRDVVQNIGDECNYFEIQNVCRDGLVCNHPTCEERVDGNPYDFFRTECVEPDHDPNCPPNVCPDGWHVQNLDPVLDQEHQWSTTQTFSLQDMFANDYPLRSACDHRDFGGYSGQTHTFEFTAIAAGRYRFYFSDDTVLQRATHFRAEQRSDFNSLKMVIRGQCMLTATELGCVNNRLKGTSYDVSLDLTENQSVYIHVSHGDTNLASQSPDATPWPYTLQVDRVR